MRTERSRFALVVLALAMTGGCDSRHSTPTAPFSPGVTPVTMEITGNGTIAHPGETTQLAARLSHADGTSEDVTQQARWSPMETGITEVTSPGLVRALSYGTSTVTASYGFPMAQAIFEIRVAPPDLYLVQGTVRTLSGRPLASARVTVKSSAGRFTAATHADGGFALPATGDAQVRVVEEGFVELARSLSVARDEWLDLVMESPGGTFAGTYQVTITASRGCELPQAAMQRTFGAVVEEIRGTVYVEAMGYQFVGWAGKAGFTGTRDGDRVTFQISDNYAEEYSLVERIAGVGDLCFAGAASGTIRGGDVSAAFEGTLRLEGASYSCTASDHRLEMIRTGGG